MNRICLLLFADLLDSNRVAVFRGEKKKKSGLFDVIRFVGTVSITLTGAVFCFVLAPTLKEHAWNLQNILTHVVVPLVAVVDFLFTGKDTNIDKGSDLFVIVPPILYALYAGLGYILGWEFAPGVNYPYFFLNWGSEAGAFGFSSALPFMGSAWWILVLLVLLLIVGLVYLLLIDLIKKLTDRAK